VVQNHCAVLEILLHDLKVRVWCIAHVPTQPTGFEETTSTHYIILTPLSREITGENTCDNLGTNYSRRADAQSANL